MSSVASPKQMDKTHLSPTLVRITGIMLLAVLLAIILFANR